ncbi:hypothetical protein C0993_000556, partial [Termitomyces sp. T159_Od127]
MQWHITNSLEALAHEGLGLGEATKAGKGSQQGQEEEEEEEEGTKEKTPDHSWHCYRSSNASSKEGS